MPLVEGGTLPAQASAVPASARECKERAEGRLTANIVDELRYRWPFRPVRALLRRGEGTPTLACTSGGSFRGSQFSSAGSKPGGAAGLDLVSQYGAYLDPVLDDRRCRVVFTAMTRLEHDLGIASSSRVWSKFRPDILEQSVGSRHAAALPLGDCISCNRDFSYTPLQTPASGYCHDRNPDSCNGYAPPRVGSLRT